MSQKHLMLTIAWTELYEAMKKDRMIPTERCGLNTTKWLEKNVVDPMIKLDEAIEELQK